MRLSLCLCAICAVLAIEASADSIDSRRDLGKQNSDLRAESKIDSQDSRDLGESKNSLDCHEMLCISRNDGIVDLRESYAESTFADSRESKRDSSDFPPPPAIKMMI